MRHVLVHYDTPQRSIHSVTDTAVWIGPDFVADDQHCHCGGGVAGGASMCSYAHLGERVVITGLVLVSAQNDWDEPVALRVDMGPLAPHASVVPMDGGAHPDRTGVCLVRIPARHRGAINEVVYVPNFTNLLGVPVQVRRSRT